MDAAKLHFNIPEEITFETRFAESEERCEIAPSAWETMADKLQFVWVKIVDDNARISGLQPLDGKSGSIPHKDTHGCYRYH